MPFDSFDDLPVEVRIIDEALKQFGDGEGLDQCQEDRRQASRHAGLPVSGAQGPQRDWRSN